MSVRERGTVTQEAEKGTEANSRLGWGQTSSRAETGGWQAFAGKKFPCFTVRLTSAPTLPSSRDAGP